MLDDEMKVKLARLEEFGKDDSVRLMIAAVIGQAGATSLRNLADIDPASIDELLEDCAMIVGQLDDDALITEMSETAGFHFKLVEAPDVGPAD